MGLDVALVNGGQMVLMLDDDRRGLETGLQVAELVAELPCYIGVAYLLSQVVADQVIVEDGSGRGHSLVHVENGLEHLVVHPDELGRFERGVQVQRGHGSHRMTPEEDSVPGHSLLDRILDVPHLLPGVDGTALRIGHVGASDDCQDARHRPGLGGLDLPYSGVGVGTAEHGPIHHSRQPDIGPIDGLPRHLLNAVRPHGSCADDLVFGCRFRDGGHV